MNWSLSRQCLTITLEKTKMELKTDEGVPDMENILQHQY